MGPRTRRSAARWGLSSVLLVGAAACDEAPPRPEALSVTSMPRAHHGARRLLLGKIVRLGSHTIEATLSDDVASETFSTDGQRALIVERSGRLRAVSLSPTVRPLWTLYPTTPCDTPKVGAHFVACVHATSVTWFDDHGRASELASVSPIVEVDVSDPWFVTRSGDGRVTVFDGTTGRVHATAVLTTPACMQTAEPCLVARDAGVCAAGQRPKPREDPRIDVTCHDFDLELRWTKTIRPAYGVQLQVVQRGPHVVMLSSLDCVPSKHAHPEQGFSVAWRDGATTEYQHEVGIPWDGPTGPISVSPCQERFLTADAARLYLSDPMRSGADLPTSLSARPHDSWEDTWTLERPSREVIQRVELVGDLLLVVSRPAPNAPLRAEILDAVTGTLLDSHTQAAP